MLVGASCADSRQPSPWSAAGAPPVRVRDSFGAASSDGQLFLWGGQDRESGRVLGDGAVLLGDTWSALPPGPSARSSPIAMAAGTKFFIVGGVDDLGPLTSAAVFDSESKAWSDLPPAPLPMADVGASVLKVGDQIVFLGAVLEPADTGEGANRGSQPVIFDLTSEEWRVGPTLPIDIGWTPVPTAVARGDDIFLVSNQGSGSQTDVIVLTLSLTRMTWSTLPTVQGATPGAAYVPVIVGGELRLVSAASGAAVVGWDGDKWTTSAPLNTGDVGGQNADIIVLGDQLAAPCTLGLGLQPATGQATSATTPNPMSRSISIGPDTVACIPSFGSTIWNVYRRTVPNS
jgi:hypothetical protein